MYRGDRTAFRLHFHHSRHVAPDILTAVAGPGIRLFRHGRTGGDWVDGNHFAGAVGDGSDCIITICSNHRLYLSLLKKLRKSPLAVINKV
ncbi:hypothetical protein D3C71_1443520 [compost metagenome]